MTDKNAVPIMKSVDALKREVTFIYYEPNKVDSHGDWATPQTIEKACTNFNENLASGNVVANLFHSRDEDGNIEPTDSFTIQKSWVSPTDCIIGDTDVDEGTWLVKVKINSEVLWDRFENGIVSGVSFGAKGFRKGTE